MPANKYYFSNLYDLLVCMTRAIDLVSTDVTDHHQQVAFLAYNIAEEMHISGEAERKLVVAALLHDVGAIAFDKKLDFIEEEKKDVNEHAFLGADLLSGFSLFEDVSIYIKFHHICWNGGEGAKYQGEVVPLLAHVIHLADRVSSKIKMKNCIISQIVPIKEYVLSERGKLFPEVVVDAFLRTCNREAMWMDMFYHPSIKNTTSSLSLEALGNVKLTLDEVVEMTHLFSRIIDFRSPFTAMHSAGVASTAVELARMAGMSENECKYMHIAGNLHDIGKLGVYKEILEKQDSLIPEEYDAIRTHTYYTYRLLRHVEGFSDIAQWAAFHHEKLDGSGYPFHINGDSLTLGARIMAVADIFTAITEDRPYRAGMEKGQAINILQSMVNNNGISGFVVELLIQRYDEIRTISQAEAEKATRSYDSILCKK